MLPVRISRLTSGCSSSALNSEPKISWPLTCAYNSGFLPTRSRARNSSCVALVPDREGKHAAQVFRTVSAVLIVSVNDRFGVAVGVEGVTEFFEFLAQFEIVVDLAVENDPGGAILVVDGLLPAFQVDDGEAAHGEADRAVDVKTVVVRPAMADRLVHAGQQRFVNGLPSFRTNPTMPHIVKGQVYYFCVNLSNPWLNNYFAEAPAEPKNCHD